MVLSSVNFCLWISSAVERREVRAWERLSWLPLAGIGGVVRVRDSLFLKGAAGAWGAWGAWRGISRLKG